MLGWQAAGRDTNIVSWCLKHIAVWSYIYATTVAGLWLVVPWYVPHVLLVISISLAARTLPGAFRRCRSPANRRQWLALSARAGTAIVCVGTLWIALQGRTPPSGTIVDLAFPLRSGRYYTANGGSTELVNAHVRMLTGDRFRRIADRATASTSSSEIRCRFASVVAISSATIASRPRQRATALSTTSSCTA